MVKLKLERVRYHLRELFGPELTATRQHVWIPFEQYPCSPSHMRRARLFLVTAELEDS